MAGQCKTCLSALSRNGPALNAVEPNQVWAMDFVHDQLFDGKKIRVLTVVDTFHTVLAGDRCAL